MLKQVMEDTGRRIQLLVRELVILSIYHIAKVAFIHTLLLSVKLAH